MNKIDKVDIKVLSHDKTLGNSRLEYRIKSKNVDYIVINTIRRSILSFVPVYAFVNFKFEKNTSVFNNNYLKLRINNMPVWAIDNDIIYYEKKQMEMKPVEETDNVEEFGNIDIEETETKETNRVDKLNQLTMYVKYHNITDKNLTVTTDHAKFYYNGKNINSPYKTPIPIVDLQPKQDISFSVTTDLGIEEMNAMYSPVSICTYKQLAENEFELYLESRGQRKEQYIISVGIDNVIKHMNDFAKLLENNYKESDNLEGVMHVNNEDHTLGNLISRGLQQHEKISFAGYKMTHPMDTKIEIYYKLKKKDNLVNIVDDVIKYYTTIFNEIKKNL